MTCTRALLLLILSVVAVASAAAECFPFDQAGSHLGETICVRGKVLKISRLESGVTFLNFCEDYRGCPFSVVVFPRDLRDVGDVRVLEKQEIEINGTVKDYKGQIEMVLKDSRQLRGEYARLPKVPKDFDVEKHGSYSAGKFKSPKRSTAKSSKQPQDRRNPDEDID